MEGYISLYKKITEWEWYKDADTCRLFIHLLLKANYKDRNWKGVLIKRGQHLTTRKTLHEELNISEQSIRTSIKRLKLTNEITTKSTNLYTLITITRYDDYQSSTVEETDKLTNKTTNEEPTTNQRLTTPNKDNKYNNKERVKKVSQKEDINSEEFFNEIQTHRIFKNYNITKNHLLLLSEKIESWSKSKGKRISDWKATARNWLLKGIEEKKFSKREFVEQDKYQKPQEFKPRVLPTFREVMQKKD